MKLTIGMPVFNDYSGAFMTINALRHYHDMEDVELLVVNNAPESRQSFELKAMCSMVDDVSCRYVDYQEATGAANAKNAVVENALGDYVLVLDSHVLLVKDAVRKLKEFYQMVPNTTNLYQGPLITHATGARTLSTHLHPKWGSGMIGQWSTAWRRLDGKMVQTYDDSGKLMVTDLLTNEPVDIGSLDWSNHEEKLEALGYRLAVTSGEPFEISAQGMGLFSCKRSEWLGFNPQFREFGGEEFYLQDKYRHYGRATYCLPFLQWHHRFYRENQPNYPNRLESKFRNFVIGYDELGKDKTELVAHFDSLGMNKTVMQQILENPNSLEMVKPTNEESRPVVATTTGDPRRQLYEKTIEGNSNFLLKIMATKKASVTEISTDPATTICLLAGNPQVLTSIVPKETADMTNMKAWLTAETYHATPITWHLTTTDIATVTTIAPTEMLLIKTQPTLAIELLHVLHESVSKMIVVDESLPIEGFLESHPDWRLQTKQNGLAVIIKTSDVKTYGAGTELARILKWLGFKPTAGCQCKNKAHAMNIKGIEWCRAQTEAIVNWMAEEHAKLSYKRLPFSRRVARALVKLSIAIASFRGAK